MLFYSYLISLLLIFKKVFFHRFSAFSFKCSELCWTNHYRIRYHSAPSFSCFSRSQKASMNLFASSYQVCIYCCVHEATLILIKVVDMFQFETSHIWNSFLSLRNHIKLYIYTCRRKGKFRLFRYSKTPYWLVKWALKWGEQCRCK